MNRYLVAIHDNDAWDTWIQPFMATSLEDCEYKLMDYLCDYCEDLPNNLHYSDFLEELDKQNISISSITDIEEL